MTKTRSLADLSGRLANTALKTRTANLGVAVIDEGGDLGVAVTRYESRYGLPIRFDLARGAAQEAVQIDAQQWRRPARIGDVGRWRVGMPVVPG